MALCVCVSLCLQINGKQTSMCNTKSVFKIKIKTQNRHANTMDQITSEPSWAAPPEQNDTRDIFLEAWMISGRPRSVFFEGTKTRKMISNCRKSAEDEACAFDQSMCEVLLLFRLVLICFVYLGLFLKWIFLTFMWILFVDYCMECLLFRTNQMMWSEIGVVFLCLLNIDVPGRVIRVSIYVTNITYSTCLVVVIFCA